jgi:hypothetical protein
VPRFDNDICRMADEHRAVAAGIETAKAAGSVWASMGALAAADRVRIAGGELIGLADAHLADEERDVVPLIGSAKSARQSSSRTSGASDENQLTSLSGLATPIALWP